MEEEAMPGLLRGIARTATVAGTATAVSNRVSRRQGGRWAAKEKQQYEEQEAATTTPVDPMSQRIEQLKQLGELKTQGVLTDAEFEEQKRRILG
jgi:hypothetical protein